MTEEQTINDTDVFVLLDRTGSMAGDWFETVKAVNGYIREVGNSIGEKGRFSILTFDHYPDCPVVDKHYWYVPWRRWQAMDSGEVTPRGTTPLYDAIGFAVSDIEASGPAEQVTLVIVTDGMENASSEWTKAKVAPVIERLRQRGWNIVFLGADMDAMAEGGKIGIAGMTTATFDKASVGATFAAAARNTAMYASGMREEAVAFTEEERAAMRDKAGKAGADNKT